MDFAREILAAAGQSTNISQYLLPGTPVHTYAETSEYLDLWFPTIYNNMMDEWAYQQTIAQVQHIFQEIHETNEIILVGVKYGDIYGKEQILVDNTYYSPIVIDLNGDGVKTTNLVGSTTKFDLDADGVKEFTGWLSPADGFLVIDNDEDGVIKSSEEMFGGRERGQGFRKLSEFDTDQNGRINASDDGFSSLKIWVDADGDGASHLEEIFSLSSLNITELSVEYFTWDQYDRGNLVGEHAYAVINGDQVEMSDVYFRTRDEVVTI